MSSKFVRTNDFELAAGPAPTNPLEVDTLSDLRADYRVVTGIGLRMNPGNVTTLRLAARRLNPRTGLLGQHLMYFSAGTDPNHLLEADLRPWEAPGSEDVLLSGVGLRADPGNVTTLVIWTKNITDAGTLDGFQSWKLGPEPNAQLEAQITLPDPLVVVGIGVRASPGSFTTLKGYFGHLVTRTSVAAAAADPDVVSGRSRVGSG